MAVILGPARLQAQHRPLFARQPHAPELLDWAQLLLRTLAVLAATLALTLLFPLLPTRHQSLPVSWDDYLRRLPPGLVVAGLLGGAAFRQWVWKYWRAQPAYRWVGQFTVLDKEQVLGHYWLWLHPGQDHRVRIPAADYQRLEKGDAVQLVYSAEDELVSLRKV